MGALVSAYKKIPTRSGQFMAFVTVEDMYGTIECVCFPKVYDRVRNFLDADVVVKISGKISINDEKAPSIIVERMTEFNADEKEEKTVATEQKVALPEEKQPAKTNAPSSQTAKSDAEKTLWLNISGMEDVDVEELMETLCFYAGETTVIFVRDGKKLVCSQKVKPDRALMAELSYFLNESCIKLL